MSAESGSRASNQPAQRPAKPMRSTAAAAPPPSHHANRRRVPSTFPDASPPGSCPDSIKRSTKEWGGVTRGNRDKSSDNRLSRSASAAHPVQMDRWRRRDDCFFGSQISVQLPLNPLQRFFALHGTTPPSWYSDNHSCSFFLARNKWDFTVFSGTSMASAISS